MEEHKNLTEGPLARVLNELALFLELQHSGKDKRLAYLDRPIVLTLLGTVVLTVITQWWQSNEARQTATLQQERMITTQKINLIHEFTSHFDRSLLLRNRYALDRLEVQVEQQNRKFGKSYDTAFVRKMQNEMNELLKEMRHADAPSMDGKLLQITTLYRGPAVRKTAESLLQLSDRLDRVDDPRAGDLENRKQLRESIRDSLIQTKRLLLREMCEELLDPSLNTQ